MITVGENLNQMAALIAEQVRNMNWAYRDADRYAAKGDLLTAKIALEKAETLRQSARRMGAKV